MKNIQFYQDEFQAHLEAFDILKEPKSLYEPIRYILELGGKRLRPVLTLMTTEVFNGDYKNALNAALCVEVFHNFTLIHDDIMDDAPLRRGKSTVHETWNVNTGILSGDAMLIKAYQLLEQYEADVFKRLTQLFSKTALEVCEGQQYDIDFETRNDVTIKEYIKMIEYKTAVLVGMAMKMGAIVAHARPQDQEAIYQFGKHLGIAFQLQDDYLDAFGDPETFGKQVGGDIIENKKTFLYLKALEFSSVENRDKLMNLYTSDFDENQNKVETVKTIFEKSGATIAAKKEIKRFTDLAFSDLENMDISPSHKNDLRQFGEELMNRSM